MKENTLALHEGHNNRSNMTMRELKTQLDNGWLKRCFSCGLGIVINEDIELNKVNALAPLRTVHLDKRRHRVKQSQRIGAFGLHFWPYIVNTPSTDMQ